jgi:hypothetical protein
MNEFIEKTYPLFRQWVKETKGYATVDSIEQIKLWHEFLSLLKEQLNDK